VSDSSFGKGDRALAGASAPAAPFPRLEEDKCNRKHSRKGRYSAEMNILGYINEHGENNVAELVVTVADCLSSKEFQKKWHSFLTGFLKRRFPSGMWTRERQPRSGNWHAHCVVNLGRDIKTGFPIAEVESGNYRNVQLWIRALWKELREAAERYGVGRISLLPIKKTGPAAAKYFVKYVAKSHGSVKSDGEERCRLFGTWGTKRWCYSRFSWVSSRIFRKRLTFTRTKWDWRMSERYADCWATIGGFGCESLCSVLCCRSTVIRFGTGNWSRTCGMSLGFGRIVKI
jgi:hypothetical protein